MSLFKVFTVVYIPLQNDDTSISYISIHSGLESQKVAILFPLERYAHVRWWPRRGTEVCSDMTQTQTNKKDKCVKLTYSLGRKSSLHSLCPLSHLCQQGVLFAITVTVCNCGHSGDTKQKCTKKYLNTLTK